MYPLGRTILVVAQGPRWLVIFGQSQILEKIFRLAAPPGSCPGWPARGDQSYVGLRARSLAVLSLYGAAPVERFCAGR